MPVEQTLDKEPQKLSICKLHISEGIEQQEANLTFKILGGEGMIFEAQTDCGKEFIVKVLRPHIFEQIKESLSISSLNDNEILDIIANHSNKIYNQFLPYTQNKISQPSFKMIDFYDTEGNKYVLPTMVMDKIKGVDIKDYIPENFGELRQFLHRLDVLNSLEELAGIVDLDSVFNVIVVKGNDGSFPIPIDYNLAFLRDNNDYSHIPGLEFGGSSFYPDPIMANLIISGMYPDLRNDFIPLGKQFVNIVQSLMLIGVEHIYREDLVLDNFKKMDPWNAFMFSIATNKEIKTVGLHNLDKIFVNEEEFYLQIVKRFVTIEQQLMSDDTQESSKIVFNKELVSQIDQLYNFFTDYIKDYIQCFELKVRRFQIQNQTNDFEVMTLEELSEEIKQNLDSINYSLSNLQDIIKRILLNLERKFEISRNQEISAA